MPVTITRRETFSAGHTLFNPAFTPERNREIFGKCSNPSGHGHNYILEVSLRGETDPDTGFVFDLSELAAVMRKCVLNDVDHKNLNVDVDWLTGVIPTTENLVCAFWDRLDSHLPQGLLHSVRLGETEKNWAQRTR